MNSIWKNQISLPSAQYMALDKSQFCRVSYLGHSANLFTAPLRSLCIENEKIGLPSARSRALDKPVHGPTEQYV